MPTGFGISGFGTELLRDSGGIGAVSFGVTGGVNVGGGGFFAAGDASSGFGPLPVTVENADVKDVRVVVPARR